ncbi:hypothetical protein J6590_035648, partial [Homalodisca vitripennis]
KNIVTSNLPCGSPYCQHGASSWRKGTPDRTADAVICTPFTDRSQPMEPQWITSWHGLVCHDSPPPAASEDLRLRSDCPLGILPPQPDYLYLGLLSLQNLSHVPELFTFWPFNMWTKSQMSIN